MIPAIHVRVRNPTSSHGNTFLNIKPINVEHPSVTVLGRAPNTHALIYSNRLAYASTFAWANADGRVNPEDDEFRRHSTCLFIFVWRCDPPVKCGWVKASHLFGPTIDILQDINLRFTLDGTTSVPISRGSQGVMVIGVVADFDQGQHLVVRYTMPTGQIIHGCIPDNNIIIAWQQGRPTFFGIVPRISVDPAVDDGDVVEPAVVAAASNGGCWSCVKK